MVVETALGIAFKVAVQNVSKKKQIQFIAHHIYSKYAVFRSFCPLAIGIDRTMIEKLPQFDADLIMRALANHCRRPRYIKALAHGGKRYGLDGKPKGEITSKEQNIARQHPTLQQAPITPQSLTSESLE